MRSASLIIFLLNALLVAGAQERRHDEPRLGVAFVLAYGETIPAESSFWRHQTTLCTVLANLESTVATLQDASNVAGIVEPMVMTLGQTMPKDVADFFWAAGVTVRDMKEAMSPLKSNGVSSRGTPWLQAIKVHAVRLFDYDAILVVDVDIFLLKLKWDWDIFGEFLASDQRFILQSGYSSPINAGFFAVKPAKDLAKRLDDALQHGYNPDDDFYGGQYSKAVESLGKDAHYGKTGWHYLGANTDQGLLLHLIAAEPHQPGELIRDTKKLPLFHLAGMSPKTWFPNPLLDECAAIASQKFPATLRKETQDQVATCYGAKRIRFEHSFWVMWTSQLHNQTWTEKTRQHATCDTFMSAELERRKAILGESVIMENTGSRKKGIYSQARK